MICTVLALLNSAPFALVPAFRLTPNSLSPLPLPVPSDDYFYYSDYSESYTPYASHTAPSDTGAGAGAPLTQRDTVPNNLYYYGVAENPEQQFVYQNLEPDAYSEQIQYPPHGQQRPPRLNTHAIEDPNTDENPVYAFQGRRE